MGVSIPSSSFVVSLKGSSSLRLVNQGRLHLLPFLLFIFCSTQEKRISRKRKTTLAVFSLSTKESHPYRHLNRKKNTQELAQELLTAIPTLDSTSPETGNDGTPTHTYGFSPPLLYSYNKLNIEIWCRVQGELTDGDGSWVESLIGVGLEPIESLTQLGRPLLEETGLVVTVSEDVGGQRDERGQLSETGRQRLIAHQLANVVVIITNRRRRRLTGAQSTQTHRRHLPQHERHFSLLSNSIFFFWKFKRITFPRYNTNTGH